ncbi:MAG: hypothetical protein KL787_05325 [Taibaiella sp.]|nr:hypothetical protein [Taibaiella sp.]
MKIKVMKILKPKFWHLALPKTIQITKTGWGTYFGPMWTWVDENGTIGEVPSLKQISQEMISYWEERINKSKNPIIKARYAGLVWEFKNKITGTAPSFEICIIYINSLIDISNGDYHKRPIYTIQKLKRALELAIAINNDNLIQETKKAILDFERRHSKDEKPGSWGYSFDLLISNKLVTLSEDEEEEIISNLEAKLERLSTKASEKQKIDPWAAEAAARRLGVYYRKQNKSDEVKRVILNVGEAYNSIIGEASALQVSGWLQHVYSFYSRFGLKEEADEVLLRIRELGPKVASELKPISHSFELPKDKMNEYISEMTTGDLENYTLQDCHPIYTNKTKCKGTNFRLVEKCTFDIFI